MHDQLTCPNYITQNLNKLNAKSNIENVLNTYLSYWMSLTFVLGWYSTNLESVRTGPCRPEVDLPNEKRWNRKTSRSDPAVEIRTRFFSPDRKRRHDADSWSEHRMSFDVQSSLVRQAVGADSPGGFAGQKL
jgi:hypothetical protein